MYPQNRDQILEGLIKLNETLGKMIAAKDKDSDVSEEIIEVRVKAIRGIIMQVDNSLGELHDMLDTMEHYQDERHQEACKIVNELENSSNELIDYLRAKGKY